MKCVICRHDETHADTTVITLTRGETTIVFEKVPAEICENCGEYYLSDQISAKVLAMAEKAVKSNQKIEVIQFTA